MKRCETVRCTVNREGTALGPEIAPAGGGDLELGRRPPGERPGQPPRAPLAVRREEVRRSPVPEHEVAREPPAGGVEVGPDARATKRRPGSGQRDAGVEAGGSVAFGYTHGGGGRSHPLRVGASPWNERLPLLPSPAVQRDWAALDHLIFRLPLSSPVRADPTQLLSEVKSWTSWVS